MTLDLWVLYCFAAVGLSRTLAPWLARHGRWFNRAAGATFVGIGAALTTASR